jgi:hypothetical protein
MTFLARILARTPDGCLLSTLPLKIDAFTCSEKHNDTQGCQMAYFQTKNPNLGDSLRVLQWKMLAYFIDIWYILVCCIKKNWATLMTLCNRGGSGLARLFHLFNIALGPKSD